MVVEIKKVFNKIYDLFLGHTKHEWTSYSAMESVFKYLEQKYEEFLSDEQKSKRQKVDN